jgi:hypothetical protein
MVNIEGREVRLFHMPQFATSSGKTPYLTLNQCGADMKFELKMEGREATRQTLHQLSEWLREEKIEDLTIEQKKRVAARGEMGGELELVLALISGTASVVTIVKAIYNWIQARHPQITIIFSKGDEDILINAEDVDAKDIERLIEKLKD